MEDSSLLENSKELVNAGSEKNVLKERIKIEFDEKKNVILISTSGGNKIELGVDDRYMKLSDANKNELVLNRNGITISSAKDIRLCAKGNILVDALGTMDLNAKSDIKMSGMNVKAEAKVGLSAKGNATAELSASGQTTVKGAMVMIN